MKKISFKWRQDQLTKPCWAILKPEAKREKKSVNTDPFVFNFDFKKNYIKMFSLLITKFFSIPLNFVLQVSHLFHLTPALNNSQNCPWKIP